MGCYEISRILFNKTIGLVSAGLYIICPFVLLYDRMALADGILSAFSTLTLLWSISIIKEPKKEYVWLLGVSIALGILTKIFPGIVLLSTPLIVWLCLPKRKKSGLLRYFRNVYLLAIGFNLIPICIFFKKTTQIVEKSVFAPTSFDFLQNFSSNVKMASEWLWAYWTPTVMILGMIGFIMALVKKQREAILLSILVLFPIVAIAGISRVLFPRYILFVTVPFLILTSWSLVHLKNILEVWGMKIVGQSEHIVVNAIISFLFFVILFFPARRIDYYLWTDPSRAPLPRIERIQYVEEWPSGYGVKEAVIDLLKEAERHPEGIVVVHHELADTTHFGLRGCKIIT
jgi:4-amino-4-deoxy-L-arabinose transferase-like glycosyltransferase